MTFTLQRHTTSRKIRYNRYLLVDDFSGLFRIQYYLATDFIYLGNNNWFNEFSCQFIGTWIYKFPFLYSLFYIGKFQKTIT